MNSHRPFSRSPNRLKILLVQPWIADFAAYNFWIRPLGLYSLAEWAWERGADVHLVDCLSPSKAPGKFNRTPEPCPEVLRGFPRTFARYGITREDFRQRLRDAMPFDAVLVTSAMSYWYKGVRWAIEEVKKIAPDAPIILGGIYATLWTEHAEKNSGADLVLPGNMDAGENGKRLARITGLPCQPVRERMPWYRLGLHDGADYAAVRTATGCPYKCTYCASHRISGGFRPRPATEIIEEIDALYRIGVRQIAFYDDALLAGFSSRLMPVLEHVYRSGMRIRFHTPNGMHARLLDETAASCMARSGFVTFRISLETTNPARQKDTGGKVSTEEVSAAVKNLLRAGIKKQAIGIYLLVGLPGQDLEEIRQGINFTKSLGIRPYLAEFSPIPGTFEWQRLEAAGTVSMDMDPLLTNNSVFFRWFSGFPGKKLEDILRTSRTAD